MQKTRTHTCCETSCQSKGWIFQRRFEKNFHLGRQTFRLLPYLQVGTSEEKLYFWVMSLSQFVPFIYFPRYVPIQRPKKDRLFVCFHHLKRCTSQLCVDDLVLQLAGIPNLGFFGTTNNVVRPQRGGFFGGNKNIGNFQWMMNIWKSVAFFFFGVFLVFLWVDSWKLYWWMFSFLFGSFRWNFRCCGSWRTKLLLRITKHPLTQKKSNNRQWISNLNTLKHIVVSV